MTSTEQVIDTDLRITGGLKVHGPIDGTASRSKWSVLYGATTTAPLPNGGVGNNVFASGPNPKSIDQLINGLEAGGFNVGIYNVNEGLSGMFFDSTALVLTGAANSIVLVRSDVALQQ